MIRNLKALGLVAVAALAMSAMFASAAQAQGAGIFTAGLTPGTHTTTNLTGTQYGLTTENVFVTPNSEVHCLNTGVSFSGSVPNGTSTAISEIKPTYKDCTAKGELPATVTMNGCTYTFRQPTSEPGSHTTWTGNVDLVCPPGVTAVVIDVYLGGTMTNHNTQICTITVFPATNLSHVTYHNVAGAGGKKDDVTLTVDVAKVPFEEHGAFCPDGNTVKGEATYTSNVTVSGKNAEGVEDDVWISTVK